MYFNSPHIAGSDLAKPLDLDRAQRDRSTGELPLELGTSAVIHSAIDDLPLALLDDRLHQQRSAPAIKRLYDWLETQRPLHLPKRKMGEAITYAINNRDALTKFLTDAKIPISNSHSECQLRGVALGRKNYMSVGHVEAGEKIAALYTIVACCKAVHVNPTTYLTDLFERLDEHPDSPLESLMPSKWKPPE